jgi:hypothetical protein
MIQGLPAVMGAVQQMNQELKLLDTIIKTRRVPWIIQI